MSSYPDTPVIHNHTFMERLLLILLDPLEDPIHSISRALDVEDPGQVATTIGWTFFIAFLLSIFCTLYLGHSSLYRTLLTRHIRNSRDGIDKTTQMLASVEHMVTQTNSATGTGKTQTYPTIQDQEFREQKAPEAARRFGDNVIEAAKKRLDEEKAETEQEGSRVGGLTAQTHLLKKKQGQDSADLDAEKKEVINLQSEIEILKQQNEDAEKKCMNDKEKLENELSKANEKIKPTDAEGQKRLKTDEEQFKTAQKECKSDKEKLEKELAEAIEKIKSNDIKARERLREAEEQHAEAILKLTNNGDRVDHQIEDLKGEINAANSAKRAAEDKLEQAEEKLKDLAETKKASDSAAEKYSKELSKTKTEKEEIEKKLANANKAHSTAKEEVERVKKELSTTGEELTTTKEKLSTANIAKEKSEQDLKNQTKSLEATKKSNSESSKLVESFQNDLAQAKTELGKTRKEQKATEEKFDQTDAEREAFKRKIKELQSTLAKSEAEKQDLEKTSNSAQDDLKKKVEETEKSLQSSEKELEDTKKTLQACEATRKNLKDLEQSIKAYEQAWAKQEDDAKQAQRKLAERNMQIEDLQKRLEEALKLVPEEELVNLTPCDEDMTRRWKIAQAGILGKRGEETETKTPTKQSKNPAAPKLTWAEETEEAERYPDPPIIPPPTMTEHEKAMKKLKPVLLTTAPPTTAEPQTAPTIPPLTPTDPEDPLGDADVRRTLRRLAEKRTEPVSYCSDCGNPQKDLESYHDHLQYCPLYHLPQNCPEPEPVTRCTFDPKTGARKERWAKWGPSTPGIVPPEVLNRERFLGWHEGFPEEMKARKTREADNYLNPAGDWCMFCPDRRTFEDLRAEGIDIPTHLEECQFVAPMKSRRRVRRWSNTGKMEHLSNYPLKGRFLYAEEVRNEEKPQTEKKMTRLGDQMGNHPTADDTKFFCPDCGEEQTGGVKPWKTGHLNKCRLYQLPQNIPMPEPVIRGTFDKDTGERREQWADFGPKKQVNAPVEVLIGSEINSSQRKSKPYQQSDSRPPRTRDMIIEGGYCKYCPYKTTHAQLEAEGLNLQEHFEDCKSRAPVINEAPAARWHAKTGKNALDWFEKVDRYVYPKECRDEAGPLPPTEPAGTAGKDVQT
ncbi:hypothetical protein CC80DRAFT_82589 [Byssothecium circinans]|uniref:Uncharacterized protein n=1 Tax=Byssothecium circinans TaxID=147558 RepID=A0A6A5TUH8_9PLEO|nr:hypothetical protein CC80DRAFT_82589 [Byssothecium circinans]